VRVVQLRWFVAVAFGALGLSAGLVAAADGVEFVRMLSAGAPPFDVGSAIVRLLTLAAGGWMAFEAGWAARASVVQRPARWGWLLAASAASLAVPRLTPVFVGLGASDVHVLWTWSEGFGLAAGLLLVGAAAATRWSRVRWLAPTLALGAGLAWLLSAVGSPLPRGFSIPQALLGTAILVAASVWLAEVAARNVRSLRPLLPAATFLVAVESLAFALPTRSFPTASALLQVEIGLSRAGAWAQLAAALVATTALLMATMGPRGPGLPPKLRLAAGLAPLYVLVSSWLGLRMDPNLFGSVWTNGWPGADLLFTLGSVAVFLGAWAWVGRAMRAGRVDTTLYAGAAAAALSLLANWLVYAISFSLLPLSMTGGDRRPESFSFTWQYGWPGLAGMAALTMVGALAAAQRLSLRSPAPPEPSEPA